LTKRAVFYRRLSNWVGDDKPTGVNQKFMLALFVGFFLGIAVAAAAVAFFWLYSESFRRQPLGKERYEAMQRVIDEAVKAYETGDFAQLREVMNLTVLARRDTTPRSIFSVARQRPAFARQHRFESLVEIISAARSDLRPITKEEIARVLRVDPNM
jgi:hypothetical protein